LRGIFQNPAFPLVFLVTARGVMTMMAPGEERAGRFLLWV
jgi:hypothetical protein